MTDSVDEFVSTNLPRYGRTPRDLLRDPSMPDRAVRLYGMLDDYASAESRPFPRRATLAAAMGCSLASIDRALRDLTSTGWVIVRKRFRPDGGQSSNLYVLAAAPSSPVRTPLVTSDDPPSSPVTSHEGTPDEGPPPIGPPEPSDAPALLPVESVAGVRQTGNMSKPATRSRREAARDGDPLWDAFWAAYPRKTGKGAARRAWPKAVALIGDGQRLVEAAQRFADEVKRERQDVTFLPHPSTWLNQERWTDEPTTPTRTGPWTPAKKEDECPRHTGEHRDRCRMCASEKIAVKD